MIKLNGEIIKPTIFPDKTSQVWKFSEPSRVSDVIEFDFENESEVFHLYQLLDYIESTGSPVNSVSLKMSYLPYARQDKEYSTNNTFALNSFLRLINSFRILSEIEVFDPHSTHLFPSCFVDHKPTSEISLAIKEFRPDLVLFPDAGAVKRYKEIVIFQSVSCIVATKNRDQSTGEINGISIEGSTPLEGKRILMIDDICDGGRTFIELAKNLKEKEVADIGLYTSHGIYSKGLTVLRDSGINYIKDKNKEF